MVVVVVVVAVAPGTGGTTFFQPIPFLRG